MFQSKIDKTIPMPSFCMNRLYFWAGKHVYVWFRGDAECWDNELNNIAQKLSNNWGLKSPCDSWGESGPMAAPLDWLATPFPPSCHMGQKKFICSDLQWSSCRRTKAEAAALQTAFQSEHGGHTSVVVALNSSNPSPTSVEQLCLFTSCTE